MDRDAFLASSGLEVTTLEVWIEQRWLAPRQTKAGLVFEDVDVARVRLIHELQHNIGANDAGVDIILHLMDQLHGMRRTMDAMRGALGPGARLAAKKPRGRAK